MVNTRGVKRRTKSYKIREGSSPNNNKPAKKINARKSSVKEIGSENKAAPAPVSVANNVREEESHEDPCRRQRWWELSCKFPPSFEKEMQTRSGAPIVTSIPVKKTQPSPFKPNHPMGHNTVSNLFKGAVKDMGLDMTYIRGAHSLRHHMITTLANDPNVS